MKHFTAYFQQVGLRRFVLMLFGNLFLGLGIGIFKLSAMGNDPFTAMVMSLSDHLPLSYASFLICLNLVLFLIELWGNKKLIGVGTIVNMFLMGYVVTFFVNLFTHSGLTPNSMPMQVVFVLVGVVITSFGVALYQRPDVGVAPYDALSLILDERLPIPYFWCRMATDVTCAVITFFAGGLLGLGTLICAFGLGPIVSFFNVTVVDKLLGKS